MTKQQEVGGEGTGAAEGRTGEEGTVQAKSYFGVVKFTNAYHLRVNKKF